MIRKHLHIALILTSLALLLLSVQTACSTEAEPTPAAAPALAPAAPALTPTVTVEKPVSIKPKQYDSPPSMTIDLNKKYTATIHMVKGGEIVIELFPREAPDTVNNFVFLARDGYYDGVTFHRVIPDFMAQTGDPTGTGTGGPGYRFDDELSTLLRHDGPGVVSMANAGIRNGRGTNGSQFFISYARGVYSDLSFLDGYNPDDTPKDCTPGNVSCHTVFGRVIDGMAVADGLTPREPGSATFKGDVIRTITIEESK